MGLILGVEEFSLFFIAMQTRIGATRPKIENELVFGTRLPLGANQTSIDL